MSEVPDTVAAHQFSSLHRSELAADGVVCGCFHCCKNFSFSQIDEWVDADASGEGQTAMCPMCEIDSVIGSCSGYPITCEFLREMRKVWFS